MILLDTNVISEALRPGASPAVMAWIDAQAVETLYLSTISLAELHFGIEAMPDGKRRDDLRAKLGQRIVPVFEGRILPFGAEAAEVHGKLRASARAAGKAIGAAAGYIAAIAAAHKLAIATRDVSAFEAAGLIAINPWAGQL
jgi:predicted nucleic acid-binding protein